MKYMSIGVKIHINKLEHYKLVKERMMSSNIEFYSRDVSPEKFEPFILSGYRVSTKSIQMTLNRASK